MKVLITGAAGQIGTDLVTTLAAEGHQVVATDLCVPASPVALAWEPLDVTDRDAVERMLTRHRPDVVYHLAAILSARGEAAPQRTYEINQTGTYNVLEACRTGGIAQLIYTSTIAVYGAGLADPTPEDVPLHPTTMYGVTKAAGELLCEYYRARYGLDVRGVRFPGLISAALPGGGTSDYALLMYYEGLRSGSYEAFCRPDTRIPLMYMPDAIRSLRELSAAPAADLSRTIYNVAAMSPSAEAIAQDVARGIPDVRIRFAPDPPRQQILDSWPRALDDSLARRDWGWQAHFDLPQMTDDLLPRIRTALDGHQQRARAITGA